MKKVVLTISEIDFEKFRFESIEQRKSIEQVLSDRLFYKSFSLDTLNAVDAWLEENIKELMKD